MARNCTICNHAQQAEINLALFLRVLPYRAIAARYGVGRMALQHHEHKHLPELFAHSKELRTMLSARALAEMAFEWQQRMVEQYNNANAQGDFYAMAAVGRVGIAALLAAQRIASDAQTVEADPATIAAQDLPPQFDNDTLRTTLRMLIEAGVAAMPAPHTTTQPGEEIAPDGQATDSAAS